MATSEAELIKKFSMARGNSEPEQAPTEPEAVDVSVETPEEVEEVAEVEVEQSTTEASETVEAEEEAGKELSESDSASEEELYVEINGREVALSEVAKWENEGLMQADYTRKTQAHAKDVEAFKVEKEGFEVERKELQSQMSELKVILNEETLTPEALKELREYEPEEFIKYQEKIAKRKEMLGAVKEAPPVNNVDVEAERAKLWANNPDWMEDGKQTDAFTNDMKAMQEVGLSVGYSMETMNGINEAKHFELLRLAAIGAKSLKSNASIEKKLRKAPVTTKPRAAVKSSLVTQIEKAKARLKQTGRPEDAAKLRKLRLQQSG